MKKFIFSSLLIISISSSAFSSTYEYPNISDEHEQVPIPAIVIEDEEEVQEDPQWTYKFLIPTSIAIATLVIIGNIVQYFRQVTKKRYKVIKK